MDAQRNGSEGRGPAWKLGALGVVVGVLDVGVIRALGVDLRLDGHDVTAAVALYFAASFGALGWLLGRLYAQRARLRADAETIRAQRDALRAARQRERALEKLAAVGQMAAGVAHEVRNPLAVIRSSAGLLRESAPDDAQAQTAGRFIEEEVDRLDGFVRSLLDFARPADAGGHGPVEVQALLETVERLAADEARRAGFALAVEAAEGALEGDADQLVQLLFSLVVNAGEAGAEKVAVRASVERGAVRLEVADDGPGVPPDDAERIFEPFFTTRARGTGLGLAMARKLAEAHRARLELVEGGGLGPAGGGACFRLTLATRTREVAA